MINETKKLLRLAEDMVAYGKKKGADQVEVSIGEGSEFSVNVRQGDIEKLVEAGSKGLSIKVILDQRVATASSSDFSKETLHRLMDNAVLRAKVSSPDPFAGLPDKEDILVDAEKLKIFDPKIIEMQPEKKIAAAKKCEKICLGDKRIKKSYGADFNTYVGTTFLANSNGFNGYYSQTTCSSGVYLQAGEGDNLFDEGKGDYSRILSGLMTPESIAKEAVHRVTRLIGAKKVKTQNVPVVLESQMTEGLLGFLSNCINGNSVYLKQTFLADKLGQKIAGKNVTILDDTSIGNETIIWSGTVIRERCRIGNLCIIHPNVTIGADGFGYRPSPDGKGLVKIPQIGTVEIGDGVEIGAGSCIDRGKFSATTIGDGTKIDNLVQVAHNCKLGLCCVMAGQSGLAGSVTLGNAVMMGGGARVKDHVTVGDNVKLGGNTGVIRDVPPGKTLLGVPADDHRQTLRLWSAQKKLPALIKQMKTK